MPIHATALGQSAGESVRGVVARHTMAYVAGVEAGEALLSRRPGQAG